LRFLAKSIKLNSLLDAPLLIFGIISTENILKLSWLINQLLNIRLSQTAGLISNDSKSNNSHENSLFQFEDERLHLKYSLMNNRIKANFYFNELKNIDHLLFIRGEADSNLKESVMNALKNSADITSVLSINPKNLKIKGKLEQF
jgi:hypothetical protein